MRDTRIRPVHNRRPALTGPFNLVFTLVPLLVLICFIATPVIGYYRVSTLQKALNQECGTNYSILDVATAGEELQRLCQIKKQEITIRNK